MTKQEQMFALVEAAEQSTQTIAAFCASRDIRMKTFFYWRRKLLAARSAAPAAFVPITAPAAVCAPDNKANSELRSIRLSYPNGVELQLSSADVPLLAQLIRLI